jgi:hypothetical protein
MSDARDMTDRIVLGFVAGWSIDHAERMIVQSGASPRQARKLVADARKRLTRAAAYNRDEQLGTAVTRLNALYQQATEAKDSKTALQAQREINRLLDLYASAEREVGDGAGDAAALRRQLDLIAGYLLPLKLAGDHYPVEEHARIAADVIRAGGMMTAQAKP